MTDTPIPPLPCTFGDGRVPLALWHQIQVVKDTECWHWSGPTSPTGSPIYRRKSVWRLIYDAVCGGRAADLPRSCPPRCGLQRCVNPDHRVPPNERIPVLSCPTCGQPTYLQYRADPTLPPVPEKKPVVHPAIRGTEESSRVSMADLMESEFEGPGAASWDPATVPYGPAEYRLTGRVFTRPGDLPSQYELVSPDGERAEWKTEEELSSAQESHLLNLTEAFNRGGDSVFTRVTRLQRFGKKP